MELDCGLISVCRNELRGKADANRRWPGTEKDGERHGMIPVDASKWLRPATLRDPERRLLAQNRERGGNASLNVNVKVNLRMNPRPASQSGAGIEGSAISASRIRGLC